MKGFLDEYGQWLRHKVRVVILKQWKKPETIFKNLTALSRIQKCGFEEKKTVKRGKCKAGMVPNGYYSGYLFLAQSNDTWQKDKEPTGIDRPFSVLSELMLDSMLM